MFDYIYDHGAATHVPALCAQCAPLRDYARNNKEALLNAATLLGGRGGARLARAVIDGLGNRPTSQKLLRSDLGELWDLLMLQHVHDPDRIEAGLFAAIDPWDPVVEDICLLADGLRDAIANWDAGHDDNRNAVIDRGTAA